MGHVTIAGKDLEDVQRIAREVKEGIKVISASE